MNAALPDLLAAARCPACRSLLNGDRDVIRCTGCKRTYPIVEGIPLLLADQSAAEHDEMSGEGHHHPDNHKTGQAQHFDSEIVEEFEIRRPHLAPRLYRFLIGEKIRRATAPVRGDLEGATALTVCGGSGMEAEYLSRMGAKVISSDISLGAAKRTRERARRYGIDITPIVADIEHLPFDDRSIDLVLVHDGLHHLEDPSRGLAEMMRVARRWVSVTEPALAAVTGLAVRIGLALEQEESGNRVQRMSVDKTVEALSSRGFQALVAERYAMYYSHRPGFVSRVLSRRFVFPLTRAVWRTGNRIVGRFGNKMVVVAKRVAP